MSDQPAARRRQPAQRQAALSMRIAPATRDELIERAGASGRSVTQEADRLLQHGLMISKMMAGSAPMLQALMEFDRTGSLVARERGLQAKWQSDPDCYMAAAGAAISYLIANAPEPFNSKSWRIRLDNEFLSALQRRHGPPGDFIADEDANADEAGLP